MITTSRRPSFRPALSPAARAVATAVALAAALALAGCGEAPKAAVADKPTALQFGPNDLTAIRTQPIARTLPISGSLIAVNQAIVKAKVAVEVRQINVREGDRVEAGQTIAKLDTVDLVSRLDQATGQRNAAHAQFEIAEKNRTTNASLLEKHFISQNAFDNVASLSSANRATLDAADAQLRMAQKALRDATVIAPITGIVSRKNAQIGEKTLIDAPLFAIVDLDSIEMQAIVPAGEVSDLAKGMHASLTVDGMSDRTFDAQVSRVNPSTEPGTRSIVVFFTVPNPEHVLKSGMYANGAVRLATGSPRPTLPASAVQSEAGIPIVWTIEDGKLVRRTVVLGDRDVAGGIVEIKSGVPPGVPVLASKFDNLKEGGPAVAAVLQPSAQAAR
jgi:membrane fusion protein, multidrug efflux system